MPRRHSSGRKDYSTRTERRSANQYQNITLINRPPPAYLLVALGFVEVVLLYAGLHLSVGYALFYKCRVPHFVWHTLVGDTEDRILRLVQGSMRRSQLAFVDIECWMWYSPFCSGTLLRSQPRLSNGKGFFRR
jgi:hypothetical protein